MKKVNESNGKMVNICSGMSERVDWRQRKKERQWRKNRYYSHAENIFIRTSERKKNTQGNFKLERMRHLNAMRNVRILKSLFVSNKNEKTKK